MELLGTKDIIYICGIVIAAITTFLTTKFQLKEYTRDKFDSLKDEISDLRLKIKDLEAKDGLQQQVIDQFGKQIEDLIPKLMDAINKKENGSK
jgi:hypothetical protein